MRGAELDALHASVKQSFCLGNNIAGRAAESELIQKLIGDQLSRPCCFRAIHQLSDPLDQLAGQPPRLGLIWQLPANTMPLLGGPMLWLPPGLDPPR